MKTMEQKQPMARPLTVAIAGCGSRGQDTYARLLKEMPERVQVVAAADIMPEKLRGMRDMWGLTEAQCYFSAEEMLTKPRLADVMLICTPDRCHFSQAKAALLLDYDLLLEKPISPSASECRELAALAQERGRQVVVCHVLRYTPFYQTLKRLIDEGAVGEVVSMQGIEQVCYWHQAHSFVRGNWRNEGLSSCMILQKCCHDTDILLWLCGKHARRVSSFGSLYHFRPENAPEGAAKRCTECQVAGCPYNAVDFYLKEFRESGDDWPQNVVAFEPTEEKLMVALREGPYGRCVYACDNDVVDHQVLTIEFEDGATADYTMAAFTAHGGRTLRVMGTRGELLGDMKANTIRVMRFGQEDEIIDVRRLATSFSGHGGGDGGLIREFVALERGEIGISGTLTSIGRSVESHLVALAAEESRKKGGMPVNVK